MARRQVYVHPAAQDAARVLGQQVRLARQERRMTAAELATRVGVSARTILAVEAGAPGTAIGTVLTAAVFLGVPLFGVEDRTELTRMRLRGEERLALLPSRVHHLRKETGHDDSDDF